MLLLVTLDPSKSAPDKPLAALLLTINYECVPHHLLKISRTSIGIPIRGDGGNLLRSTSSERREQ